MIELQGVSKRFNLNKPNEVVALQDVSLRIDKGDFVIVVGSNGSGKSTLLNLIAGKLRSTSGRIIINQNDVSSLPEYKRSKWIARVFQDPMQGTAGGLTILDNFRLAAVRPQSKKLAIGLTKDFIEEVREKVSILDMGLENKLNQSMGSLSGGQRQALSLLMSVMADLDILLLDEPTAALDPRSAEVVLNVANKLISDYNITAVMVTHNMKEAYLYGDRLLMMKDGCLHRDLTTDAKKKLEISDIYEWFA